MLGCLAREECGSGGNVNGVMAVPEVDPGIVPAIPVVGKGKGGKAEAGGPRGTRDRRGALSFSRMRETRLGERARPFPSGLPLARQWRKKPLRETLKPLKTLKTAKSGDSSRQ